MRWVRLIAAAAVAVLACGGEVPRLATPGPHGMTSQLPLPPLTATPAAVGTGRVAYAVTASTLAYPTTTTSRPLVRGEFTTPDVAARGAPARGPASLDPAALPDESGPQATATPAPAPTADPNELSGFVRAPSIGLTVVWHEGVDADTLARGPGHWPGTALPGGHGNMVLGGHRTTYSHPFLDLDQLSRGDPIVMTGPGGEARFYVYDVFVVTPDAIWIADADGPDRITLFACHPKGSAAQRIVAVAYPDAAGPPPTTQPPPTATTQPGQGGDASGEPQRAEGPGAGASSPTSEPPPSSTRPLVQGQVQLPAPVPSPSPSG